MPRINFAMADTTTDLVGLELTTFQMFYLLS